MLSVAVGVPTTMHRDGSHTEERDVGDSEVQKPEGERLRQGSAGARRNSEEARGAIRPIHPAGRSKAPVAIVGHRSAQSRSRRRPAEGEWMTETPARQPSGRARRQGESAVARTVEARKLAHRDLLVEIESLR